MKDVRIESAFRGILESRSSRLCNSLIDIHTSLNFNVSFGDIKTSSLQMGTGRVDVINLHDLSIRTVSYRKP